MSRKDLTGQTIDKLFILEIVDVRRGENVYNIQCECGNIIQRTTSHIQRLKYKSCGCSTEHRKGINRLPGSTAALNSLYRRYKYDAIDRGYNFDLSIEWFEFITQKPCFYCNAEPSQAHGKQYAEPYIYNGIDRYDNTLGYTEDNALPCCGRCNMMKRDLSGLDYINQCILVAEHMYKEKAKNGT